MRASLRVASPGRPSDQLLAHQTLYERVSSPRVRKGPSFACGKSLFCARPSDPSDGVWDYSRNGRSESVRAMRYTGERQAVCHERETPRPARNEVLIRMKAAGICGSDLHVYR